MAERARILIAGAGIGGLALAHALRRAALEVAVYERDPTPKTRNQGYRLHVDSNGNAALRTCLTPEVLDRIRRTSGTYSDSVTAFTPQLERVMAQTFPGIPEQDLTNVDRDTFRRDLLADLGEIVRFGHTLTGYHLTDAGRVAVEFAEGGSDEGDLLIGADGVGSMVRRQLLPHAVVRDLGRRCVYGRIPITETTEPLIPADFGRGFSWVADGRGYGAGFATMRYRTRPEGASDYLMTALVTTPEWLGLSDEQLSKSPPAQLWQVVVRATADWHPDLRELVAQADRESFFPITIRATERVDPWPSGPVTVLGDAIHTMPPTGGAGANTALQDAATLAEELQAFTQGRQSLPEAVAAYEQVMLPRGFATVDRSLQMADRMFP